MDNTYKIGISELGRHISCWWSQPYGLPIVHYTLSDFKVVSINNRYYLCARVKCSGYSSSPTSFFTLKIDNKYIYRHHRIPIGKFFVINLGDLNDGMHSIYLQFWNDFNGYFGKPSISLKFKVPLKFHFEVPNLPFYNKNDILEKLCGSNIYSREDFLKSFNIYFNTIKLDENEYGILHINNHVPNGTTVCIVNDKTYCQSARGYIGEDIFCKYRLPLLPGVNTLYSKHKFKYSISTLKDCEPHSVRELKIHKSSIYTISYDKPAIGIFKLKRPIYQETAPCTPLAGGDVVSGWIAVKFPGCYNIVTGSGDRILPNVHPFNIIDVSQSRLYVKKEQYASVICTLEKHTNSIHATFKSDRPCNFTAVAYFNDRPIKKYSIHLFHSNKLTQTVIIPIYEKGKYCIAPEGQNKDLNTWKIKV